MEKVAYEDSIPTVVGEGNEVCCSDRYSNLISPRYKFRALPLWQLLGNVFCF
jgi:hypothetical protein